jgi:uncharacterized coiled-coil protein SlyX
VTYRYDDDVDYEPEPEPRRRMPWTSIIFVAGLAFIGIAAAFLWRSYGSISFPTFSAGSATPAVTDKGPGLGELQALQQQSAAQIQTALQLLTAQQAEIKKLSDQLAALIGRFDSLQQMVAAPQPAPPPTVAKPVAPPVRKKPPTTNQSTTGAPPPAPIQIAPAAPNRP